MRLLVHGTLEGIPVFVEAVQAGSFARAGDRLALSRSAIGKTIARLESRLGVRLFHRTTSSLALTIEGQIYYEKCLQALEELRSAEALLDSGRQEVSGRVKITMPLLFGRYCAEPVLFDLAKEHPALELDLRFNDSIVDLLGERFDLAIRNHTVGNPKGMSHKQIARQTRIICASPEYLAKCNTPTEPEHLAEHDALVYRRNEQVYPWTLSKGNGEPVEPDLKCRLQSDNHESLVAATVRGMGIACLPGWLIREHLKTGRLVQLLQPWTSTWLPVYAVWPTTSYMPLRISVIIETLERRLRCQDPNS